MGYYNYLSYMYRMDRQTDKQTVSQRYQRLPTWWHRKTTHYKSGSSLSPSFYKVSKYHNKNNSLKNNAILDTDGRNTITTASKTVKFKNLNSQNNFFVLLVQKKFMSLYMYLQNHIKNVFTNQLKLDKMDRNILQALNWKTSVTLHHSFFVLLAQKKPDIFCYDQRAKLLCRHTMYILLSSINSIKLPSRCILSHML